MIKTTSIKNINPSTGSFTIDNDFIVSQKTCLKELTNHFGETNLKESAYRKGCFISSQRKIGELYFKFRFNFNEGALKSISFEIEIEPIERIAWSSNEVLETNWIAQQTGDKSGYVWDLSIAGQQYNLSYPWGEIGVYYDFKNGTFESILKYGYL